MSAAGSSAAWMSAAGSTVAGVSAAGMGAAGMGAAGVSAAGTEVWSCRVQDEETTCNLVSAAGGMQWENECSRAGLGNQLDFTRD